MKTPQGRAEKGFLLGCSPQNRSESLKPACLPELPESVCSFSLSLPGLSLLPCFKSFPSHHPAPPAILRVFPTPVPLRSQRPPSEDDEGSYCSGKGRQLLGGAGAGAEETLYRPKPGLSPAGVGACHRRVRPGSPAPSTPTGMQASGVDSCRGPAPARVCLQLGWFAITEEETGGA